VKNVKEMTRFLQKSELGAVLSVMTSYSIVVGYQGLGKTCCLPLLCEWWPTGNAGRSPRKCVQLERRT
jgi:hypothetical protein